MATDRQVIANRANAAKSTGPRTKGGRKRSSQNARIHGLSAACSSLADNPMYERVTRDLAGVAVREHRMDAANDFAAAQMKLRCISEWRQKMYEDIDHSRASMRYNQVRRIAALDRYERYAYTQLFRALSMLEG